MKRFTQSLLVVATLAVFSQVTLEEAAAQRKRGIVIGGIKIEIPGICPRPGPGPGPLPGPRPNPVYRYRITMYHPHTGGVIYSRVVTGRRAADSLRTSLARRHWKMWKYNGIGERWHSRQFGSYTAAARYRPPFNLLGIARQYVRAGRVRMVRLR